MLKIAKLATATVSEAMMNGSYLPATLLPRAHGVPVRFSERSEVGEYDFEVLITEPFAFVNVDAVAAACGGDASLADDVATYLHITQYDALKAKVAANGNKLNVKLNDKELMLELGTHFTFDAPEAAAQQS